MKFGLIPINVGYQNVDQIIGMAQHAENCGFESLWTFEHVIVPEDYASPYPYDPSGKMGADPETNFYDPLITLATVAAHTRSVRLATGVNILPQTNPLLLAKQAATLDALSKGRFMLGVGIGWLREEFDAMGVPFERRGARFDDYVAAMKKVWSGEIVEHQSDFLNWSGFGSHPLPAQKPHLPVIIGGAKGKVFERIAKLGEGWYAPTVDPAQLEDMLQQLRAACDAIGRDMAEIEITSMWDHSGGLDSVEAFAEIGVDRLMVRVAGMADPVEAVARIGQEIIARS